MDLLERKFANDSEAHILLAMIDAAISANASRGWYQNIYIRDRIRACVVEHIRLSGDQYDHRR
jgi:hypothetical protein